MKKSLLLLLLKYWHIISGRVHFQKIVFLLIKNYSFKTNYEFKPYRFGPYCQAIQEDIQELIEHGYIHEEAENNNRYYQITKYGEQYLLEKSISKLDEQVIQELHFRFGYFNSSQLVSYVYSHYPEYTIYSEVKGKFYKPQNSLRDFTPADALLKEKMVHSPEFIGWIKKETEASCKRLGISSEPKTMETNDFQIGELYFSLLKLVFKEEIIVKAQKIINSLILDNFKEVSNINKTIITILESIEDILVLLQEGALLGIYLELSNWVRNNLGKLREKLVLYEVDISSNAVNQIKVFVNDVISFLEDTDRLFP